MGRDTLITPSSISKEARELVERQLNKVLATRYFNSAKQMQRFLTYIVKKTLDNKGDLLKQYTIGIEALSLAEDFDPESNPAVRIIGGRVRERLKEYYENDGLYDEIIIRIPKGSYTPEFKKNIPNVNSADEHHVSSRGPKLALVCFSDRTQDKKSNRFIFQITDTMAKELSRFLFASLVVYNPYADKDQSFLIEREMKADNRADYILTLYLQQLPKNKYELLYRLIDVDSDEVLWSESYAINNVQPIDEQDHILGKIIATVADIHQGILFSHWSRRLLENEDSIPGKYQALAYFQYFSDGLDSEAFAKSVEICKQALERNPEDIIANVLYAEYCRRDYVYSYSVIQSPLDVGKKCAETATRLKPNSHEAHYALGQIYFCLNEWERSVDELNLARDISQYHPTVEYGCGFHFCMMGKWTEGMALVKKAMSLSSTYPAWFHLCPFLDYYRQEKYQEALSEADRITTPSLLHGPLARSVAHAQLGELKKAKSELHEVLIRYPQFMEKGKTMLYRFLGSDMLAKSIWDEVLKASDAPKLAD